MTGVRADVVAIWQGTERAKGRVASSLQGNTPDDYILSISNSQIREKTFASTARCLHIPVIADLSIDKEHGHMMANYQEVLHKGLKEIRGEGEWHLAQLDQPFI
jgi:hypothetical protein